MSEEKPNMDKLDNLVIEMIQKGTLDLGPSARTPVVDCNPKNECTCKGVCDLKSSGPVCGGICVAACGCGKTWCGTCPA